MSRHVRTRWTQVPCMRKYALETSPGADCENMCSAKIILSPYAHVTCTPRTDNPIRFSLSHCPHRPRPTATYRDPTRAVLYSRRTTVDRFYERESQAHKPSGRRPCDVPLLCLPVGAVPAEQLLDLLDVGEEVRDQISPHLGGHRCVVRPLVHLGW